MAKVYVRVANKAVSQFYRCGFLFTKEWQAIEADDASVQALESEQMLDVRKTPPWAEAGPGDAEERIDALVTRLSAGVLQDYTADEVDKAVGILRNKFLTQPLYGAADRITPVHNVGDGLEHGIDDGTQSGNGVDAGPSDLSEHWPGLVEQVVDAPAGVDDQTTVREATAVEKPTRKSKAAD